MQRTLLYCSLRAPCSFIFARLFIYMLTVLLNLKGIENKRGRSKGKGARLCVGYKMWQEDCWVTLTVEGEGWRPCAVAEEFRGQRPRLPYST